MTQTAADAVPDTVTLQPEPRTSRNGPSWLRIFVAGLTLWSAAVLVTFATRNVNLIPTIILLGSFLVPVAFVAYAFGHADQVVTAQRILAAFVYGGVLGVLGASVLEAALAMIRHRIGGLLRRPLVAMVALVAAGALVLAGCDANPTATGSAAATSGLEVSASAQALQQQFVKVVKQVGPSVVLIQSSQGLGSGVVFDTKGDVVTNNHVVQGASGFQVTLANGKQYHARLVGSFAPDDLAVLQINAGGLQQAAFADSSRLQVGDVALAIGNPLGLQSSVTEGIVSALGRTVNEDNGVALPNVIQTSAPINPGNSGGALVNLQGQVIGIPTLAATDPQLGGSAPGIGFAIPSNTVGDIASQLIEQGKVTRSHRAFLGVQVAATTSGGLLVAQVQPGGPAAKAGIRAGELLAAVNGTATPDPRPWPTCWPA